MFAWASGQCFQTYSPDSGGKGSNRHSQFVSQPKRPFGIDASADESSRFRCALRTTTIRCCSQPPPPLSIQLEQGRHSPGIAEGTYFNNRFAVFFQISRLSVSPKLFALLSFSPSWGQKDPRPILSKSNHLLHDQSYDSPLDFSHVFLNWSYMHKTMAKSVDGMDGWSWSLSKDNFVICQAVYMTPRRCQRMRLRMFISAAMVTHA